MGELRHDKWVGTTYGNGWMHRWLIRGLRVIDVRLLYLFTYLFIVPPTILINKNARRTTYSFFRRHLGLGRLKSAWMTYVNHCKFSQVVIDKFAMYAGKHFRITIDGFDSFQQLTKTPKGFIQLSSHIGNYEIAGYSLKVDSKRMNALVFGGEKESVMKNRSKLFDSNNIRMIPICEDMSHLFMIDKAVSDGEIVSMPADRVFGSQKCFEIDFLGEPARFPQGPFILASLRDVPMLFVSVMKVASRHYHITVHELQTDPSSASECNTAKGKARALACKYVDLLESTVRCHPAQWYNYFDFWAK